MPAKMTNIQPVPGMFIPGVPAQEMQVPKGEADYLVKTGAFKLGGSGKPSADKEAAGEAAVDAVEASEGPSAPDVAEVDEEDVDSGGEA